MTVRSELSCPTAAMPARTMRSGWKMTIGSSSHGGTHRRTPGQMRVRAAVEMFQKLAEKEAEDAQIEYTGKVPYLDPDTGKIVLPSATAK